METTLHISKIDQSIMLSLRHQAEEMHISVEELVRGYLRERILHEVKPRENSSFNHKAWIDKHFGSWTEEEFLEFEKNTAPMRQIDPELWK